MDQFQELRDIQELIPSLIFHRMNMFYIFMCVYLKENEGKLLVCSTSVGYPPNWKKSLGAKSANNMQKKSEGKIDANSEQNLQTGNSSCYRLETLNWEIFISNRIIWIFSVDTFDFCLIRSFSHFLDIPTLFRPWNKSSFIGCAPKFQHLSASNLAVWVSDWLSCTN